MKYSQKNLAAGLFGSLVTFAETNSYPLLWSFGSLIEATTFQIFPLDWKEMHALIFPQGSQRPIDGIKAIHTKLTLCFDR